MPSLEDILPLHPLDHRVEPWLLDPGTPVRDIEKYFHRKARELVPEGAFQLVKVALDARIADQAQKSAEILAGQTQRLIQGVNVLATVAQEQKRLAETLERQTNKLIWLTWAVLGVSVALLLVAVREIMR